MKRWVALFFACAVASGQCVAEVTWDKEPESLLGIRLGVPLAESLGECPKNRFGYTLQWELMCWQYFAPNFFEIANPPAIGVFVSDVKVGVVENRVETVFFQFLHLEHEKVATLLMAKYGPPTQVKSNIVQNKMGASFESKEMTWIGKNLTLSYNSRAGKIDRGLVSITSRKYVESKKFNADEYKDKL